MQYAVEHWRPLSVSYGIIVDLLFLGAKVVGKCRN